ncbi:MAG: hypothetical protein KME69_07380 [Candidatus Thiodiazotropha sp. (ex Codakia orbicularis)]|nr:hypothetical protein [Candidatus Thiodiazotropha sp. (ex Codakia orbicularis)]
MMDRKGCLICLVILATNSSDIFSADHTNEESLQQECAAFNARDLYTKIINKKVSAKLVTNDFSIKNVSFGFNTSYTISKKKLGYYPLVDIKKYSEQFNIDALRFPGGTVANYFDWNSMSLEYEWNAFKPKNSVKKLFKKHIALSKGKEIQANITSFFSAINEFSLRPFIVLNLYTQNLNDTISAIDKIKVIYNKKIYWELGNELGYYDYSFNLNGKHWDVELYAHYSTVIAKHIKDNYPEDEVGIVAGDIILEKSLFDFQEIKSHISHKEYWNKRVSEVKNVDAVIYHPYLRTFNKDKWRYTDIYNRLGENCVDYLNYMWLLAASDLYPKIYKNISESHFSGKKEWLTELGIISHNNNSQSLLGLPGIRTLLLINYYISWLKTSDNVEAILYHILGKGKGQSVTNKLNGAMNENGAALSIVNDFLVQADSVKKLIFEDSDILNGVARLKNHSFKSLNGIMIRSKNDKSIILVINLSTTTEYSISGLKGMYSKKLYQLQTKTFKEVNEEDKSNKIIVVPPMSIFYAQV